MRLTDRGLAILFLVGLAAVAAWTAGQGTSPDAVRGLPCPFDAVFAVDCPGCGMTRACVATVRGDWAAAWRLQPFAFLLIALAAAVAGAPRATRGAWRRVPARVRSAGVLLLLALAVLRGQLPG